MSLDSLYRMRLYETQFAKIVTHADCADGAACAAILSTVYPDVPVVFMHYDSDEHKSLHEEAANGPILFADFTPHQDNASAFQQEGEAHVCLDHHKYARAIVDGFGMRGYFADADIEPKSGAVQAWEFIRPTLTEEQDARAAKLAAVASIYDTWQKGSISWELSCAQAEALKFFPHSIWRAHINGVRSYESLIEVGDLMHKDRMRKDARSAENARRFVTPEGKTIAVVPHGLINNVAELTGADATVGFFYADKGAERLVITMRSKSDMDVGSIAKSLGGGGHQAAAGFSIMNPVGDPYAFVQAAFGVGSTLLEKT
jgi:oligoribonuclease NrnB/cAMP/cGMP phosphodiesterase (DHH superfamily)